MIQYRVKIGFLTDGDLWYIFIADVTASSPKDDCVRVAQFAPRPMSADQSPLFCGSPWATLLACLALADPNGLPIRSADDPLSTAYPVTRQSGPYRAQPDGPGPVTRAQARQANTLPGGTGQSDAANAQQQLLSIASGLEYRMVSRMIHVRRRKLICNSHRLQFPHWMCGSAVGVATAVTDLAS